LHCIDSEASLRPTCTSIGEREHLSGRPQPRRRRVSMRPVAWLPGRRSPNTGGGEPFGEPRTLGCRQLLWPRPRLFCASIPATIAQSREARLCLL